MTYYVLDLEHPGAAAAEAELLAHHQRHEPRGRVGRREDTTSARALLDVAGPRLTLQRGLSMPVQRRDFATWFHAHRADWPPERGRLEARSR